MIYWDYILYYSIACWICSFIFAVYFLHGEYVCINYNYLKDIILSIIMVIVSPVLIPALPIIFYREKIRNKKLISEGVFEKDKIIDLIKESHSTLNTISELSDEEFKLCQDNLSKILENGLEIGRTYFTGIYKIQRIWDNPNSSKHLIKTLKGGSEFPAASNPMAYAADPLRLERPLAASTKIPSKIPVLKSWAVTFTQDFVRCVEKIDRKIQGRILESITEISNNPVKTKGNTIKPLSRDLNGLWRYRIGDFRLIYQPVPVTNQVLLLSFKPRSKVYE